MRKKILFSIPIIALLLAGCDFLPGKKSGNNTGNNSSDTAQTSDSSDVNATETEGETPTSSSVPVRPEPGNLYDDCNEKYQAGNASGLLSALRSVTSAGHSRSYDQLYQTYKSAYLRDDGKIFDYYSSITNYDPDKDRAGSYKSEGDCFNREHSIPQSWWGGGTNNQGSDPFVVVPTDGYVNNARSSDPFGMVQSASKTFSNSKSGQANPSWGYTGKVFEPDNSVKGDFARIYFYVIAKYSNSYGWTKNNGGSCFSGSASSNFGLTPYAVKLFSYWSNLDPVSEWELHVNNAIDPIQGNRNPFIDHPEYANVLWGNVSGYTTYTY